LRVVLLPFTSQVTPDAIAKIIKSIHQTKQQLALVAEEFENEFTEADLIKRC